MYPVTRLARAAVGAGRNGQLRVIPHRHIGDVANPDTVLITADLAIELRVGLAHHRRLAQLADQCWRHRVDIGQLITSIVPVMTSVFCRWLKDWYPAPQCMH